jgi:guanine deaminase
MSRAAAFLGTFVHTPKLGDLKIVDDHLLVISPTGTIERFGPYDGHSELPPKTQILPLGSFLVPAFCDLHLHAPQYLYLGNGLHLPLMEWLDRYAFRAEERLDNDPELARRVYQGLAQRLISLGTGAALLFGTIKEGTKCVNGRCYVLPSF